MSAAGEVAQPAPDTALPFGGGAASGRAALAGQELDAPRGGLGLGWWCGVVSMRDRGSLGSWHRPASLRRVIAAAHDTPARREVHRRRPRDDAEFSPADDKPCDRGPEDSPVREPLVAERRRSTRHLREGQVRVTGGSGQRISARVARSLPGVVHRHPDQRGAVAPGPRDIDGRLLPRDQPPAGDHRRGEER
jgi:hypothetical protein